MRATGTKLIPPTKYDELERSFEMLMIERIYFPKRPLAVCDVAQRANVAPETLSRIIGGKQSPGYGEGQSAERIAAAVGWTGDVHALFAEVGDGQ